MTNKLLLTGGTGFFGKAILRFYLNRLHNLDTDIFILSRDPETFISSYPEFDNCESIHYIKGDILDRSSLPWDLKFSHILHAATDSTLGPSLSSLFRFNQIVDGTRNILDLALATSTKRFLLTSSGGIYGTQPPDCLELSEDWYGSPPLDNTDAAYSHAKRAAEFLCSLYRKTHKLETVVARCFAFSGQDLPCDAHFAIGNFIKDALTSEYILVKGDGTPLRSYLDQFDLAHWLFTLMFEGVDGEAYNVGSNRAISIAELAYLVRDILAINKSVLIRDTLTSSERHRYVPSIDKICALHKLAPTITLEDSIVTMAKSYGVKIGLN